MIKFDFSKYFETTQIYYYFFDGLFNIAEENKIDILNELSIPDSSYRTDRNKQNVVNSNHITLLSYFKYNEYDNIDREEIEILLAQIYLNFYYRKKENLIQLYNELIVYIDLKNHLVPLLKLFKLLIIMISKENFYIAKEVIREELDYLVNFINSKYFENELYTLLLLVLYFFSELPTVFIDKLPKLTIEFPKLLWFYYIIKSSKLYLQNSKIKTLEAASYYTASFIIFEETFNYERLILVTINIAVIYNVLEMYPVSIGYSRKLIKRIHYNDDNKYYIALISHYLFSLFMVGNYDEISYFINVKLFNKEQINENAAIIILLVHFFKKNILKIEYIHDKYKEFDDFKKYNQFIKTKDVNEFCNIHQSDYNKLLINKLIKLV